MNAPTDQSRPQVVAAVGIERVRQLAVMLSMVTVPVNARILELDTDPDFGNSASLLGWASRRGRVVSVHESPRLIERVDRFQRRLSREHTAKLAFRAGPLYAGWASEAPYDLIVSHAEFGWLPEAWLTQCAAGATIVLPIDRDGAEPRLFVRVVVNDRHEPIEPIALVELDPHPLHSRYERAPVAFRHEDGGYMIATDVCAVTASASTSEPAPGRRL